MILNIVLGVGMLATAGVALTYREQRDNLAAAWVHFHPEDFPDMTESDE